MRGAGANPSLRLQAGGTLNPRRHVYIERPEDAELFQLLLAGEYVNVLTSRQMGKSSLMVKTMGTLRERGVRAASIDLAAELGGANDPESWFRGLISRVVRELKLDIDITSWWGTYPNDAIGQRLQRFMREVVGTQISGPVVIFLDEIDSTLKHDFTDAFFTAIRGMYNERSQEPAYERITFCLLGVATPNELIKDRRTTAYNVGQTLELRDFDLNRNDLRMLVEQLPADSGTAEAMLARILYWTGGQPYLTVKLCAALRIAEAGSARAVDAFVEQSFTTLDRVSSEPHFQQILRFVETRLSQDLETLDTYARVLKGERIREHTTPAHLELKLSGLVKRDSTGCLVVRNRLYQGLFDARWLATMRPQRRINPYTTAAVMLALLLPVSLYFGSVYYRQEQLIRALENLGGLRITVAGNVDSGFELTLPDTATQQELDDALAGFPRPEKIRIIRFQRERQGERDLPRPFANLSALRPLIALQTLDLSDTQVSSVEPLKDLTALQTLRLSGTQVSSVEPLKGLTALQTLDLSDTQVSSVEPLKDLTALQTLNLSGTQVSSVEPLKGLTALQTLDLSGTQVSSVEPLKGLTALRTLLLSYTQVRSVEPLKDLTALQTLRLSGTQVSSVEPLKDLTALRTLSLARTQVSSVEPLKDLTTLQTLSLLGTQVRSVEPLKDLTALQALDLSDTEVSSVEPLKGLPALQMLLLSDTQVRSVEPLKGLTALQTLRLSGTQVRSVEPLKGLPALQTLRLWGTQVSSVEPLKDLTALQTLDLSGTQVSSVEPLKGLTALRMLLLSDTEVSSVEPLKDLTALRTLTLARTQVSSVEPLKGLTALQTLRLSGTQVSSVEPLKDLTALQTLDLSGTQVSSVEPLADLRELVDLNVSNTAVTTLAALFGLPNLQNVNIEGTQISPNEAARFNNRTRKSGGLSTLPSTPQSPGSDLDAPSATPP